MGRQPLVDREPHAKENDAFIETYKSHFNTPPDQFAAQAYDAMHIAAEALKKVKLSGDLAKDREAVQAALPPITWTGATGAFAFKRAMDKSGKPAGYDASQTPIVSTTRGRNYEIEK